MKNIMLDLETMGTGPNAAIAAIGACEFDLPDVGAANPTALFYERVGLQSSVDAGLTIDVPTILWWMQQSEAARKSTFEGEARTLIDALHLFNRFLAGGGSAPGDIVVWGNGATFDNVVIRSAYKAIDLTPYWSFRNDKCYRTVINLLEPDKRPPFVPPTVAHNALDDAIAQASHLQKVWHALGLDGEAAALTTAGSVGASDVSGA